MEPQFNLQFDLSFRPGDLTLPFFIMFALLSIGLVLAGRKVLWLFIGALVFYMAFAMLTEQPDMNEATRTLFAFGIGALVAVVALIVRPLTAILAGLVFGIALTSQFIRLFFPDTTAFVAWQLALTLVVVLVSIVVTLRYRDDAFIVMSVLLGASLFLGSILYMDMNTALAAIVWLSLCLLGVIVQYATLQREHRAKQFTGTSDVLATPTLPTS